MPERGDETRPPTATTAPAATEPLESSAPAAPVDRSTEAAPPADGAPEAEAPADEAQTKALMGKLWSRKRHEPATAPQPAADGPAHVEPGTPEEPPPAPRTEPPATAAPPPAEQPDVAPVVPAPLAEVAAEEGEQPRERKRWRWPRRAPVRVPEAAGAGPEPEADSPEALAPQAPPADAGPEVVAPSMDVAQADEPPTPPAAEPPALPQPPAAPADSAPPDQPKVRLRKRARPLPLPDDGDRPRIGGRRAREQEPAEPLAPIDLAAAKVYLPPPPAVPEAPAARVALPSAKPVWLPAEPEPGERDLADLESPEQDPEPRGGGESAEEFFSAHAAQWEASREAPREAPEPPPILASPEPEEKRGLFKRAKKPKVKVSNGFEYTVPPRGANKRQPVVSVGPAPGARREINCPRCGQPSPRGLCEACEDALSQLRQLTEALEE